MFIDELVKYCNEEYKKRACNHCNKKESCSEACKGNCKNCLDDIHFHKNVYRDDYSCEKLLGFYVCRYSYKYCSEIIYALEQVDLYKYPYFNILSLGCGAAPDLMAFKYMNYPQELRYSGIDSNSCWKKIHTYIENEFDNPNVKFYRNIDVLTYFNNYKFEGTNILIIQYLISYFYKNIGPFNLIGWFNSLANNIVKYKPVDSPLLIIINDVDSKNTGRDIFPRLIDQIKNLGFQINYEIRKRFKDEAYFKNSLQYQNNDNKFKIPQFLYDDYCVARYCESVQLIIEVK